jgi:hypothetical protein
MSLLAFISKTWNRGEIHDFTHPLLPGSGIAKNGTGSGTPAVDGASQTGTTLVTDGWGNNETNAVRAGDVIKLANDTAIYMVDEDASSNGTGQMTIPITPALRKSPGDGDLITISGVTFTATIMSRSQHEGSSAPQYYGGVRILVAEALI